MVRGQLVLAQAVNVFLCGILPRKRRKVEKQFTTLVKEETVIVHLPVYELVYPSAEVEKN